MDHAEIEGGGGDEMTEEKKPPKVTRYQETVDQPKPDIEELMAANEEYLSAIEAGRGKEVADQVRAQLRTELEADLATAPKGPVEIAMVHMREMMFLVVGLAVAATIGAVTLIHIAA